MADRFSRFLKLERPHQRGEQQTPVVNADRFAPEEQRTPGSGIAIDEEPADAQPFLRCARCEMDNTRFAATCANCGAQLHTPEQEVYNRQLWQKRRAEAAAEAEAVKKMHQPPPPVEAELARERLRAQDPRYTLGEVLAREVADHEEARLGWMGGGMNVPFGIRNIEHTQFVRQTTRTDINDTQQHGVAVSYSSELIRAEVMGIAGNFQIQKDANRERGYSGYVELAPLTRFAVGVSSLVTHAAQDVFLRVANTRQAHGVFARASPWRQLALLGEADYVIQSLSGAPSQNGLASMVQADYEPWQGVHLIATGETLDVAGAGISYGGWLSAAWFFAPHLDIRADFVNRSEVVGANRYGVLAYMAQGHLYF